MAASKTALAAAVLCFALGFLLPAALSPFREDPRFVRITGPQTINNDLLMYLSGCIVMSHDAYYSPTHGGVSLRKAFTPRLLNYVLEHEAGATRSFTFAGNPDLNYGLHADIQALYDILAHNRDRTLVYTTVPGALVLGVFDFEIYHARLILDEIEANFTTLTPYTTELRAMLLDYAREKGLAEPRPSAAMAKAFSRFRALRGQAAEALNGFFGFEQALLNRFDRIDRRELEAMLASHAAHYDDPVPTRTPLTPFLKSDEVFRTTLARDIYLGFLKVFAAMARERNTTLVVHLMPLCNLTENDVTTSYRPAFVEPLRQALAPFDNVRLIDLGPATESFRPSDVAEAPHPRRGLMYYITGKLQHARLLANELIQAGLVDGRPKARPLRDFAGVAFPDTPPGQPVDPSMPPIAFGFYPFVDTPVTPYTELTSYWPFLRNLGVVYD